MIILSDNKHRRPCLVFHAETGEAYGYTTGNALRYGENIEDLSGRLGISPCAVAWYNFNTGILSSYIPVLDVPSEVREAVLTALAKQAVI